MDYRLSLVVVQKLLGFVKALKLVIFTKAILSVNHLVIKLVDFKAIEEFMNLVALAIFIRGLKVVILAKHQFFYHLFMVMAIR
jgi:hypothetical protein